MAKVAPQRSVVTLTLAAFAESLPYTEELEPDAIQALREGFEPVTFRFGETVVSEGDEADALYLLVSGRARAVRKGDGGQEIALGTLKRGDIFGEAALLEGGRRGATVRASEELLVFRLERRRFEELIGRFPTIRRAFELQTRHRVVQNLLREGSALGGLPAAALEDLVRNLEPVDIRAGEVVFNQGDPAGPMFIVERGRFQVVRERRGVEHNIQFLREGDHFGAHSLLRRTQRSTTVLAVTAGRVLRLPMEAFDALMQRHEAFRTAMHEGVGGYKATRQMRVPLDFQEEILPAAALAETGASDAQLVQPAARDAKTTAPMMPAVPDPDEPFATADGHFRWRNRRKVRRFPFVWQVDQMDCGVACLAAICRYYGKRVSFSRLRDLAHTSIDGTSLRSLCRAATELGLAARAVKVSKRNLDRVPLPALAHWEGNHWVSLLEVRGRKVRIADPAKGELTLPRAEFEERWTGYTGLFDPTPDFDDAPEEALSVRWLLRFLRPHVSTLLQAVLLALCGAGLTMLIPVFTQVVVDRVVLDGDLALLNVVLAAMVATVVLMLATSFLQRFLLAHVALRVDSSALDWLTRTLLRLPLSYFQTRRTGDIERRLDGVYQIRAFIVGSGISGLVALSTIIAALGVMLAYSPQLTMIYLLAAPIYFGLVHAMVKRIRPLFQRLEEEHGLYRSHRIDAIRGMESLKAAAAEPAFREKLLERFLKLAHDQLRADITAQGFQAGLQGVGMLVAALFLWGGARLVVSGELTLGALVAFNSLVAMANGPTFTLLGLWDDMQLIGVLVRRLADVVEQEPEQGRNHAHLLPVPSLSGAVDVRGLAMRYGGPEAPPVLQDITFTAAPGATVAIVGRSGSGKTTLVRLLAGLLEPTGGSILYDGVELRSIRYRALRRRIGFVPQETHLFDGTIFENIAFGAEPDLDRCIQSARTANAHEFIMQLPLGYETRVGESGVLLSGGQRQRIVIARAVYRDPAVLILDEATSALDSESERAIQEAIEDRFEQTTVFIIAHRLSTVRSADLILVLDRGRLVEQGTHEALLERGGLYAYLVSQQVGS